MAIKVGKGSTIYSTNPKMDTSGISASTPVYGYQGTQIGTKQKSGGTFYKEAIDEQADEYGMGKENALTKPNNMRAAASLVNQGYSCDHAFDIVGKETMYIPDRTDMIKAGAKVIKKMSK